MTTVEELKSQLEEAKNDLEQANKVIAFLQKKVKITRGEDRVNKIVDRNGQLEDTLVEIYKELRGVKLDCWKRKHLLDLFSLTIGHREEYEA